MKKAESGTGYRNLDTTKIRNRIFTLIITTILSTAVLSCTSCFKKTVDGTKETEAASVITTEGNDTADDSVGSFNLLVYMIGSDLESFDAAASKDIQEMLGAASGDKLNIIIQTGGSKSWHLNEIAGDRIGRYRIRNGELETIELLDSVRMSEPETLSDFISWAGKTYPADRYGLVLWDHGGGTLLGYGLDEYYPDETMCIDQLHKALSDGGLHFDFIGFDACLMCTVETAMALSGHADYMIASEETEPSTGWYYTEWIKQLSGNPGLPIPDLSKTIIDSFVSGPDYNKYDFYTLSLVDLNKIGDLYLALSEYFKEEETDLNEQYQKTVIARRRTKSFGNDGFDQIDLFDYLESAEEETQSGRAQKVIEKAKEAVCYYQGTVTGSNGIAIYYPYLYPERFDQVMDMLYALDYDDSYFDFYRHFLNVLVKTRLSTLEAEEVDENHVPNVKEIKDITIDTGLSEERLLKTSWYDPDTVLPENLLVPDVNVFKMVPKDNFGKYGLHLPDEQWELISDIWVDYWLEMENGWLVDCGTDKYYEWDWDGDLTLDYDGKWLALNGEIVPFYLTGEVQGETFAEDYSFGYVPATLNDKGIKIQIVNDAETPYGRVVGYKYNYENADSRFNEDPKISAKGLHQFKDGDEIRTYYARYNNKEGVGTSTFDSLVYNGGPIIYNGGLEVSYEPFDRYRNRDIHVYVNFRLNDIYGNTYYTYSIDYGL